MTPGRAGGLRRQPLPGAIARPQVVGRWESVKTEGRFPLGACSRPVVEDEAVAVGGKYKGDIQGLGVIQPLLHPVADGVGVVLGLDQGDGYVGLVIEDVPLNRTSTTEAVTRASTFS